MDNIISKSEVNAILNKTIQIKSLLKNRMSCKPPIKTKNAVDHSVLELDIDDIHQEYNIGDISPK